MASRLPSLDVIAGEVRRTRDIRITHFESIDSKAGVVIGFSGVLVALGSQHVMLAVIGRMLAAGAALLGLAAFLPRSYPVVDVSKLSEIHLSSDPKDTKLSILEIDVTMVVRADLLVRSKASRLNLAAGLLSAAITCLAIAILVQYL